MVRTGSIWPVSELAQSLPVARALQNKVDKRITNEQPKIATIATEQDKHTKNKCKIADDGDVSKRSSINEYECFQNA